MANECPSTHCPLYARDHTTDTPGCIYALDESDDLLVPDVDSETF